MQSSIDCGNGAVAISLQHQRVGVRLASLLRIGNLERLEMAVGTANVT